MPFKSEAQRKYLWANEPEIARDWTDTYGSRIQKAGGQLVQPGPGRPGYQGDRPPSVRAREHAAKGQTGGGDAGHLSHNVPPQFLTVPPNLPDRTPDFVTGQWGSTNFPNVQSISPNRSALGKWGQLKAKMRGWNEEEDRPNKQSEYLANVQARRDRASMDRLGKTKGLYDTGVIDRDWDQSPLKNRLAGLEAGQWDRMNAMGMPIGTTKPGEEVAEEMIYP